MVKKPFNISKHYFIDYLNFTKENAFSQLNYMNWF